MKYKYGKLLCHKDLDYNFLKGNTYQVLAIHSIIFDKPFRLKVESEDKRGRILSKHGELDYFTKDVLLNTSYGRLRSLFIKELL